MIDRIGICDWLVRLLADATCDDVRRAIFGAVALVSQPKRFCDSHYVRLEFLDGEDNGDASGHLYCEYRCTMRITKNAVAVKWRHDAADSICESSSHEKGWMCYQAGKYPSFKAFVEDVDGKVIIGKIVGYAYRLGGSMSKGEAGGFVESMGGDGRGVSVLESVDLGDAEEEFVRLAAQMW